MNAKGKKIHRKEEIDIKSCENCGEWYNNKCVFNIFIEKIAQIIVKKTPPR